ncbi:MAG: dienelactone hydrolase family protein [Elainellaceae cyanobacterium]
MALPHRHAQFVDLTSGSITIPAYRAMPEAAPQGGVVVLQEIFGVNTHIRDITERLARQGYAAIAPALYHRQAPGFEAGYTPDDIAVGRKYKLRTQADELLQDVQAAVDHLKGQLDSSKVGPRGGPEPGPESGPESGPKIGCIGFCFGGHVAYLAATLPDVAATASFYGAGIATWCPGSEPQRGPTTLARTPQISGEVQCFFGKEDASIPAAEVEQIEAALRQAGLTHQIFRYDGAGHGFFCDRRESYRPEAAADAWEKVLDLFGRVLR